FSLFLRLFNSLYFYFYITPIFISTPSLHDALPIFVLTPRFLDGYATTSFRKLSGDHKPMLIKAKDAYAGMTRENFVGTSGVAIRDRKSTRLNSSHVKSRMPSSA